MVAFPYYDTTQIQALNDQAIAILKSFASHGYTRHEPSILQPADIFLDRSGEEIRRRTFTLSDPSGRELCLRPDLTIPICKHAVDTRASLPARLCYNGLAFRYQAGAQPTQFFQAGAELLGADDAAKGDVEIMEVAIDAVKAAGLRDIEVKVGDLAFFSALVDALDLAPHWRARLKRHFWRAGYFEELLNRLTRARSTDMQRLLSSLTGLSDEETRKAIEGLLDMVADAPQGARTRDEIVERLLEQAADEAASHLDAGVVRTMTGLLDVSGEAGPALAEIARLTKIANIDLSGPLDAMQVRLDALYKMGVAKERVSFATHFGRNLEYYTGFVFELWSRDQSGAVEIAGGGRYDTLMEAIGAGCSVPAVGCALRTETILGARRAAGGA
ncbi:MAG: ATP phosphoribosyltransferase regulatory subunit [Alphaproteobacteria bacterium]|nr:ATP phosphoribosyltransferase regulatory subunit [Alphaproteobacteria bacterium]MBL6939401.1 ATP phosphoribosyltransferase regulatory subunit [Alphaproteobacteria bacterium]MBL7097118.1 ATP phosphoribosyltransferase regulatory subunit [Alphaproteobacteria bacterium]